MKADFTKEMKFEVSVDHESGECCVVALAPYSYDEMNILFCCLGEVLDAIEKQMKEGAN